MAAAAEITNWSRHGKARGYVRNQNAKGGLSASTLARYEGIINSKLVPTFGETAVVDVARSQMREFYAKELAKTASTTLLKTHNLLSAAIKEAIDDDVPGLVKNVCAGLRPDGNGEEGQSFTEGEKDALLMRAASSGSRDLNLLKVAFETGLRSGELLGLFWDAIEFPNERLKVQQA